MSKHYLTEGTISTKAILHAGGLIIRRKARYMSLNKVWSKQSFGHPAACLRCFRLGERGPLRGMVFDYLHKTGLEEIPCKSVGYIGSNSPMVGEKK